MRRPALLVTAVLFAVLAAARPSSATWSIILVDEESGEVAVGTVTCLTNFDLLAIVPVVVVGKGGGACQSAGDFEGTRRPVIFDGLMDGTSIDDIFTALEGIAGHQQRQYGLVDRADALTFSGSFNGEWAGGVTGQIGSVRYAIQGNVLTGACVVDAIESGILAQPGDLPAKLMTGMQRARSRGGDGRCSCSSSDPDSCGCPPPSFTKSGHIGGMIVARIGDTDDPLCSAGGCADGDYFMRLNVPFQAPSSPDPVVQLQGLFNDWRAAHVGRPDAVRTQVAFDPPVIPPNSVATTTMVVTLLDWQQDPITEAITSFDVVHGADSSSLSTIGAPVDQGGGVWHVPITAGAATGLDRFTVTVDDGIRPVVLMPEPRLEYFAIGDVNGDGTIDFIDLLEILSTWGPCPPGPCPTDLDADGAVGFTDMLLVLSNWG